MSKFTKKAASIGLSLTTAVWLSGAVAMVPTVYADAATDKLIADMTKQIQDLQNQLLALQSGTDVVTTGAVSCAFTRSLTMGVKGDDVMCLQKYLNAAGFPVAATGVGSAGSETTYFGTLTKNAVAKWQAANSVSPAVGYFGTLSQAKYKTVAAVTPPGSATPTLPDGCTSTSGFSPTTGASCSGTTTPSAPGVVIPAEGIVLTLASDNPKGGALPKGVSGAALLKFVVAGTGTVDSLEFMREGIGATADFQSSGFYIYEDTTRLTTGKSLNSTTHRAQFVNLGLKVAGSARTLTLVGDIASGATSNNRNSFKLVSVTGTPTPTGDLIGNEFSIGGQAVGGLDPTSGAAPSNPNIGQKEASLQEFKLTASSTEDVELMRIALIQTGSISRSNLTNFVLKQAGTELAKASAISDKDLVNFVLDKPFLIEKGQVKTFTIYGDIAGTAKKNDTVIFRFDAASDIYAIGKTYKYPVLPGITGLDADSEADTLTVQGGKVTMTFNGPVAGDIALRAQDVTLYDFTIASVNNIDIKNLRFHATSTGMIAGEGFNDFKVWDVEKGTIVTNTVDHTTSSDHTFTDGININSGESRRFKVTADIDADNDDGDSIQVSLLAFQASDIKNLDNNTFVAAADTVPNATLGGNTLTTRTPSLDVQLGGFTSQTYVQGSQNKTFLSVNLKAVADKIKVRTLIFGASSTAASASLLGSGDTLTFKICEAGKSCADSSNGLISSSYTFSGTSEPYTITFNNLDIMIDNGVTKELILKGSIDSSATNSDDYYFYLTGDDSNVVAVDSDGNSLATAAITGVDPNSGAGVVVTVANVGDATVVGATIDSENEAGIILTGTTPVLSKFKFLTTNEDMTVNKMEILVVSSSSATATSTGASISVPRVYLYDGTIQIGDVNGYPVNQSGASSGVAIVSNLGLTLIKDTPKIITVKGQVKTIADGAVSSRSVYTSIAASGFEAQGATTQDKTITAALGQEKIIYKTKPTISVLPLPTGTKLSTEGPVFRFKVAADANEDVSWKKVQLYVAMTGATMTAVDSNPGTTGTVKIKDLTGTNANLNIVTAFSGNAVASSGQAVIAGGGTGYVTLILNTAQTVSKGSSKDYEISLTFSSISGTVGASYGRFYLNLQETDKVTASGWSGVETGTYDGIPSFIWSDNAVTSHTEDTLDWLNGRYVKVLPSDSVTVTN